MADRSQFFKTVPTLLIHGDDDRIVPIGASAHAAVKIAPKSH